jgi:serine/threonine protein kinase/tetratricopeptide (TPR) repeat protein
MKLSDAESIFHRALEFDSPAQRAGYLEGACGTNAELRAAVERLLQSHARADAAFPTEPGDRTEYVHVSEGPGTVIGKYKLLQKLGEGGMGVVYMAEQSVPFDKRVALKIIKLGMDTRAVVARFEAERQALALMNHPNIAKVLDAGATETGRPFFVMELVKGMPITEYCDKQKLSTRERLELFIPVCQAIQHAHQKGIIHRDIKPSNILVALFDGRPVPMVIDFGIAKATNQRLTQQTVFTNLGQLIGTPAYMSPEQAEGSQLDIDTRSDIYSLGVLLYELLTGTQPFPEKRLRSAGWAGMVKIILEEEPARPSTRLSTLTDEERTGLRKNHDEDPRKISLVLRRELDWIVMACLQKDRNQRYETANGLALDIARYLRGDAPEKAPPKWSYQLSKFARKHKKTAAMAAAIAVILAAATLVSTWQALRARTAEALATSRADKLAAFNDWMTRHLLPRVNPLVPQSADRPGGASILLKDAILESLKQLSTDFQDQPEIEAEIRRVAGEALQALGMGKEAEENLRRALELLEQTAGLDHTNTLGAKRTLGALISWQVGGQRYGWQNELAEEAGRLLQEVRQQSAALLGEEHPFTAKCILELGKHYHSVGRLDEADAEFQSIRRSYIDVLPKSSELGELRSEALFHLGDLRFGQGRIAESFATSRQLYDWVNSPAFASGTGQVSRAQSLAGQFLYGIWLRLWNRDLQPAAEILKGGLEEAQTHMGDGTITLMFLAHLAQVYGDADQAEESVHYLRLRADLCVRAYGKQGGQVTMSMVRGVYRHYLGRMDWAGAAAELRRQRLDLGLDEGVLLSLEALANHLAGDPSEAVARRRDYFALLAQELRDPNGRQRFTAASDRSAIHAMLIFEGTDDELRHLESAFAMAKNRQGAEWWWYQSLAGEIMPGMIAFRRGHPTKAIQLLERALAAAGTHPVNLMAHYVLAMAYQEVGREADALERLHHAESTLDGLSARGTTGEAQTAEDVAMAMVLRAEAARRIQPPAPLVRITQDSLAARRQAWSEVRRLVEAGNLHARKREFESAWEKYADATNHPAFNWVAAHQGLEFTYRAFTTAWALGDEETHIDILGKMHEGLGENETTHLYQLAEAPWPLPDDLENRRKNSVSRQKLEERGADPGQKFEGIHGGEEALILGMLAYREGQPDKALKFLAIPSGNSILHHRVAGPAFAAMAEEHLGNRDKALRLLKLADERYHQMVIVPGEGMYQPWFPTCIMLGMVIKEADEKIDPGVDNAPHVAALPPQGW